LGELAESNYFLNYVFSYTYFSQNITDHYPNRALQKEHIPELKKRKNVGLVRFELTIDGYLRTTAFTVLW
jgi:hypothetical protein